MKNIGIIICLIFALIVNSCKVDMKEKMIKNGNVIICTESFGNKNNPAILLVAGATVSLLFWDEAFCRRLASKGFYVVRYDNRDVGKSTNYEPGTTPYDIVDLTDDAITILNEYQIKKAHFVGMSLGGLIAQIAVLKHPDRVQSLTLFSSGPWGDSDPAIPEMDKRILDFQSKAETVNWRDENAVVEYMLEGASLISGKKSFDKNRSEKLIREEFRRTNSYISMFNHAGLQGGEDYYNRLNEINHPTLIIHGTEDQIWHFGHTKVMLEKIKDSKLIELEGTGHELHFEDWDTIIDSISEYIKGN